jgi:hypothetical protein
MARRVEAVPCTPKVLPFGNGLVTSPGEKELPEGQISEDLRWAIVKDLAPE